MSTTGASPVASWTAASTTEPEGLIVSITTASGEEHRFWVSEQNWAELSAGVLQAFAMMKTRRKE